jgi:biopolymer transport protein ExbB
MGGGGGPSLNLMQMFIAGGWPMYPILLLSIVTFTITLERLIVIFIQNFKLKPDKFANSFDEAFKKNNYDKNRTVDEMLQLAQKKGGICGDIMIAAMVKYKDGVAKRMNPMEIKQWMSTGVEEKAVIEMPQLEAHLIALAVIANVATLMGLFGTVFGMIEAFTAMANSPGGVKADEMAGGIAKALVCTLSGLIVAIPSLILYNWLKSVCEGFALQVQETATRIVDTLAS